MSQTMTMTTTTTTLQAPKSGNWQEGDIAFFKSIDDFNPAEQEALIDTEYIHPGATGHPVIILECSNDSKYFLVTTISAYSSGPDNDYLPPWQQEHHSMKSAAAFRAFSGSVRPDCQQKHLFLEGKARLPKPKTSWVYTRTIFVVPSSTLKCFDKTSQQLRMTQASLKDLLSHISSNWNFPNRWKNRHIKLVQRLLERRAPTSPPESTRKPIETLKDPKPAVSVKTSPSPIFPSITPSYSLNLKSNAPKPLWSTIAAVAPPVPTTNLSVAVW
ncbi:hypothetical protein F5Y04DRAFT_279944 [Hypomontagnella monticulosa]|nr:hypothetical protein F5Y04DRAFT_279944 [Hypomontagnella monticulosa]